MVVEVSESVVDMRLIFLIKLVHRFGRPVGGVAGVEVREQLFVPGVDGARKSAWFGDLGVGTVDRRKRQEVFGLARSRDRETHPS